MNKRSVEFKSTICRNEVDLEVTVKASVYWSSGMDDRNYESGYVVEDLEVRQDGPEIELTKEESSQFEIEARDEYIKG